jgi:acetylornithine deacetylase/succinyl-diaminopimelate desuccinylase-like protein
MSKDKYKTTILRRSSIFSLLLLIILPASPGAAESVDYAEEGLETLSRYLRVDTTNPPGNEDRAVTFFSEIFRQEGLAYEVLESAPHRGNIWARLEGGDEPALVLLHHTDVVPSDANFWDEGPFSGKVRDGKLYGRGALDDKSLGILQLEAFLALARSKKPLRRDVVFLATADEEAGGSFGAGYLAKHRPELFKDVGYLLNEGGGGTIRKHRKIFSVEVTQKTPLWLRLTSTGNPSHGSRPAATTSVTQLLRALQRIESTELQARVMPTVKESWLKTREVLPEILSSRLDSIDDAVLEQEFMLKLQLTEPSSAALLRNTCAITRLAGSDKINVIPATASAELDCRLLPDQNHDEFIEYLSEIINDRNITIEKILGFAPAVSSIDTELFRQIESTILRHYPDAIVTPGMAGGFTDSHFFREMGIVSYGFSTIVTPLPEFAGVHGHNERIGVAAFKRGVLIMREVVEGFVY